jgi:hypothetical protein
VLGVGAFFIVKVMFLNENNVICGSRDGTEEVEKPAIGFKAVCVD